ncbi:MAG: PKD domain-containing protein [Aquabacterium sp.]|nr:PKD domain-containing protein [Aquabacterium sp.]
MNPMNRLLSTLGLALGLTASAWSAGPPAAAVAHRAKPAFPQLSLPDRAAHGQRAIDLLGARLPEVAAHYGKSPDEFKALMLHDRTHRIDQRGRVFVVEEMDKPLPATTAAAAGSTGLIDGTLAPLDQTFLLHSKPGAKRTIYLNFKGATLSGTAWNSAGTITALPFDTDGVPYTFSTAELQRIQYIWQRVAEDYAAFDVNVTTEAVPLDQITRAGSTDDIFGTTVLITSSTGVYSCSCGGVAYLGVFDDTSEFYKPALVFYNQLGGGNEKYVAEAISHEAGHNMGLNHDGTATVGYYQGHGSGATGWGPIMGVGYYQALVQWSKGEYAGANNLQDDYVVMQSNGLPLRADDHGNTAGTATVLAGSASGGLSSASAQGVIERPTDIDVFAFAAGAGTATFTVSPAARSANLDAWVGVRDAAGNLLANINPVDALNASFSVVLPAAGTYTLSVQGTGKGDPLTTGYTNYGSLGQYAVAASYPTPGSLAPTAVITTSTLRGTAPLAVTFSGTGSSDADGSLVAYDWSFGDATTASGSTTAHTYGTPGSYSAVLRVTDNSGLSASSSVVITVDAPVLVVPMSVADIAMALKLGKNGSATATAAVKVLDVNGLPVAGASVAGSWSGLVARTSTATTDSTGVARFTSPSSRSSGTFRFTVNSVARSGYSYLPASNFETTDFVTR